MLHAQGKTTLANAFRQQLLTTQQVADTFFADLKGERTSNILGITNALYADHLSHETTWKFMHLMHVLQPCLRAFEACLICECRSGKH